ncbi:glycosyltransferase [Candidatus Woesearchaeota archaeon]|nr:glycosyltransferase [Candidatus Woesearchaeota archaeon]
MISSNDIDEVIAVDDGSTDATPHLIKQFKVKIITLK